MEIRDHVVLLDNQVLLGHQERAVAMDEQDLQDHQVNQDNVDQSVYQEILVSQDTQVLRDIPDHVDSKDH